MPVQTTKKTYITFPDGAKVSVDTGSGYFDVGAIQSAVTQTLNYTENQVEGANWGKSDLQIREMTIAGGFTLVNLDPEGIEKLGAGMFERVTTSGSPITPANQVIASGFTNVSNIALKFILSGVYYKAASTPTITSVTGSVDGALTVNVDYTIVVDSSAQSGYSIVLNTAGANLTTTAQTITIVYTSITPITSQIIYAGTSTKILTAYAMKITHTDSNSKIRQLELFAVNPNSGSFQFNFKGANEDGLEEMPLVYTGQLDTSLTDGRQLLAWTFETGAL
jgi:phage baseplate assembly protein gpV